MARPKQEKTEISEAYLVDALLLAGQYAGMLKEMKYYEDVLSGVQVYTEEMAIDELSGSTYSDSERVQSSNISKPAERIAILLAEGYVERKNAEIRREVLAAQSEIDELREKIDIIEVAMQERMADRTRAVFLCLYEKHLPWSKVRDEYGCQIDDKQISREREKALLAIAHEIELVKCMEDYDGTKEEGTA